MYSLQSAYEVNCTQSFHISGQITDLDLFMIYLHVKDTRPQSVSALNCNISYETYHILPVTKYSVSSV